MKNINTNKKKIVIIGVGIFLFFAWVFSPIVFSGDTTENILYKNTVFIDTNGEIFYTLPKEKLLYQTPLSADKIDKTFLTLLTTKEDENYYSHLGVDVPKKIFLLGKYLLGSSHRGGSTITEQWIKNKYFRKNARTFPQKIRESLLANFFSFSKSKEEIITEYINIAYFGRGAYGVEAAANRYFNKSFTTLNFIEKSFLISLLSSPNSEIQNIRNFNNYRKKYYLHIAKQKRLLNNFLLEKYKTEEIQVISLQDKKFTEQAEHYKLYKDFISLAQINIQSQNINTSKGGITVYTKFRPKLQKQISRLVKNELSRLSKKNVKDAGVIVLDAQTGDVLALVSEIGSTEKNYKKMNTVLVKRPVASTIKPFLYLLAFLEGKKPTDTILDTKEKFLISKEGKEKKYYIPYNFNGKEFGEVFLQEALSNSLNISAVKLTKEIGVTKFYNFLQDVGFSFEENADFYGLSLALGTNDESLINLASHMSLFVHGGEQISPRILYKITKETNVKKSEIQEYTYPIHKKTIITSYSKEKIAEKTKQITEILKNPKNRQKVFHLNGTLGNNHGFSVKTGTSANFKDNWTIGFRDDYIVGVWTGNLDNTPMKEVAGVDGAAVIWRGIVEKL